MTSKVVRFLGSMRLAVPLLAAIAIILIGATLYESQVGSMTVQREIYKSPWFGALMFCLAVNLGISTLSRYPWRGPRKVGFALTHWGLVTIIAGSAAVIHLNSEGMLLVRTDGGPNNQIRVEGDLLEVATPGGQRQQTDIFIQSDGSVYPAQVAGLSLLGYSDRALKTVRFADSGAAENLAVQVQLHSERMGQTLERWLAVAPASYSQLDLGPAQLEISQATDTADLERRLSPPTATAAAGTLQLGDRAFDVQANLGRTVSLFNGIEAEIAQVWPDFRLDGDNQPTTASEQFRNPALELNLRQGEAQARWYIFAQANFAPIRSGDRIDLTATYDAPESVPDNFFRIVAAPDGQLFYAARSPKGFQSGPWQPDEAIQPGWADFQVSLSQHLTHAQVQRQVVPVTPVANKAFANNTVAALHVATPDGQEAWLPWGEPTALTTAEGDYFAAFSPKMLQVPFYVKLDDFIVERNEGSESVAMWTSKVTLFDPATDTATQRTVWMNHPTWFRGWKLAQASWNPGDLQQSTLQLKREPWWVTALTWSGSLMVACGIGIMFYGPGLLKKFRRWSRPSEPETTPPSEETTAGTIPIFAIFSK